MRRVLATLAGGSTAIAILLACRSIAQAELAPDTNCYADEDCPNPAAPYCELTSGLCQPCLLDEHCGADYVCHQYECIPKCFSDMDCVAPTGYCSPAGVCLECLEDAHCSADAPLCLLAQGVGECVECIIDEDCSGDTPWCKGSSTCVECLDHADCPEQEHCSQDACVADVCEPGASSCSDDRSWVVQCDEFGASETTVEHCPNADCEAGACGVPADTSSTGTEAGSSEGQETTGDSGDPGSAPLGGRGCSCGVDDEESPLGAMGLVSLLLFARRARRSKMRHSRS